MSYLLPFKPGDKVLEVGGGDRPQFHPNLDIREGLGVDIVCDLNEPLPIEGEIYDGIFGMYIIEHISWRRVRHFISETHRVLRPGGIVVMITANLLEQCKLAIQWFEQGKEKEVSQMLFGDQGYPENTHRNGFSPNYAIKLFRDAGFHEVTLFEHPNCKTDMIIEARKSGAKIARCSAPAERLRKSARGHG